MITLWLALGVVVLLLFEAMLAASATRNLDETEDGANDVVPHH